MSTEQIEPFERRFLEKGVVAKPSGTKGWGLYADTDFSPGEPIFWLDIEEKTRGKIILAREAFGDCDERSATILPGISFCCLIEHPFWNVNHACEGNSGFADWGRVENGKISFVAHTEIHRGEEILSDYSLFTAPYDGSPEGDPWEMRGCMCNAVACRGTITGFHALPKTLQLQAALPDKAPYGRVLAHILEYESQIVNALCGLPIQYMQYLDVLRQTYDVSLFLQAKRAHA